MANDRPDARILIVGGGIGGLAAALALVRQGLRVIVLEQSHAIGEIGAGIQLGPNAFGAFDALGVGDRARSRAVYTERMLMMDAVDGSTVADVPLGDAFRARFGNPYAVIHRADVHTSLLEGVQAAEGVELVTSTRVDRVEITGDRVAVIDPNGGRIEGDALIGCDGVKSSVRQQFVGDAVRVSGHVVYRAVVDAAEFPADLKINAPVLWAGPNCHLVHYPLRGGEQYNVVVTFHSRQPETWGVTDGSSDEVQSYFDGILPRPRQLLAMPKSWKRWATADRDPIERWSFGRVTLLGDAAHPMLQYLAQGARGRGDARRVRAHERRRSRGRVSALRECARHADRARRADVARDGPHLSREGCRAPRAQRPVEGTIAATPLRRARMALRLASGPLPRRVSACGSSEEEARPIAQGADIGRRRSVARTAVRGGCASATASRAGLNGRRSERAGDAAIRDSDQIRNGRFAAADAFRALEAARDRSRWRVAADRGRARDLASGRRAENVVGGAFRRQRSVRDVSRQAAGSVATLAARTGDAACDRCDRARRFPRREVPLRRHRVAVHAPRRQVRRSHRRSGRQDRRVRDQVHVRCRALAAVPDRASRRKAAGAFDRMGHAAEGAGRRALVPSVSARQDQSSRRASLDAPRAELELHVRRLPFGGRAQALRRGARRLPYDLVGRRGGLRGVPRTRLAACCVGAGEGSRSREGADGRARRATRGALDDRCFDRQRNAKPRTARRRRDRGLRAVPRSPRTDRRGLAGGQAVSGFLSARAARAGALPRRRAAARRGVHLGLVRAEPDVPPRRHLRR